MAIIASRMLPSQGGSALPLSHTNILRVLSSPSNKDGIEAYVTDSKEGQPLSCGMTINIAAKRKCAPVADQSSFGWQAF